MNSLKTVTTHTLTRMEGKMHYIKAGYYIRKVRYIYVYMRVCECNLRRI